MASGLHTNCPSLKIFSIVLLTHSHKASYSKSLIRKNWPKHLFKNILMLKSERKQNLKIQMLLAGNSLNSCPLSGPISQSKSININSIINDMYANNFEYFFFQIRLCMSISMPWENGWPINLKNIIRQQLWPWLSEIIFDNVNAVLIYFTTTLHATIKQIVSVVSDFKVSSRGVLPYTQL